MLTVCISKAAIGGLCLAVVFSGAACSPKMLLLRQVTGMLSAEASGDVFTGDGDPELVADALPFAIKLHESLCGADSGNGALQLATGRLLTSYAHAFVLPCADTLPQEAFATREAIGRRAAVLFLRGRDRALRSLAIRHRGFFSRCLDGDTSVIAAATRADSSSMYWTIAAWLSAISADKANVELMLSLPTVRALINRLLVLAPDYGQGDFHELLISYYGGLPPELGGDEAAARAHFEAALALRKKCSPGPFVALASTLSVRKGDRGEFAALLGEALAIDPSSLPRNRLQTIVTQRKARRMLGRIDDYFFGQQQSDDSKEKE